MTPVVERVDGLVVTFGAFAPPLSQFPQTSRKDVARFLAHILTQLSPVLITNKTLSIQADAVSLYLESPGPPGHRQAHLDLGC